MHSVSKHVRLSEPTTKIRMNIDPYYQQRRCSPMTLDSGNIRCMRVLVGVPWRADVKEQEEKNKQQQNIRAALRYPQQAALIRPTLVFSIT